MRIPFALSSAVIAGLAFAGIAAREYLNYGSVEFDHLWPLGLKMAGAWLALVVMVAIISGIGKAMKPTDVPDDVAREIQRHPEQ